VSRQKKIVSGLASSRGIALGYVHLLNRGKVIIPKRKVDSKEVEFEISRFNSALSGAREQIHMLRKKVSEEQGDEHVYLIEAQMLMLDDKSLTDDTRELIRGERINAEWAVQKAIERFKKLFDRIDDEYFRDRRSDIEYVEERLLRLLAGTQEQSYVSIHRKTILVAHELSPADIIKINREHLVGIATDLGGRTSHFSILARSLDLPCVIGTKVVSQEVQNGDRIILDGSSGTIILHPDQNTWNEYEERRKQYLATRKELLKNKNYKAETKDHYQVHLFANVDLLEEVTVALENGAEGIGVLRTENLFLGGELKTSEEEQVECYKKVVTQMKPHEVVIRLFDFPGDSLYGTPIAGRIEHNPALGLRGIRLLLREVDILKSQLRAILQASAFGKVAILYPMISCVSEVRRLNQVIKEVMSDLQTQGINFDPDVRIGAMIEIPSAALTANRIAQEVDFLSIGTNDLIQYTLGVDRTNELVADLYNPLHGSVIHLLHKVVEFGHKAGIEVGVCGEIANEPMFIPLLVGLEYNFLSVGARAIPSVKQIIREITMTEAKQWVAEISGQDDPSEMRKCLSTYYASRFTGVFP